MKPRYYQLLRRLLIPILGRYLGVRLIKLLMPYCRVLWFCIRSVLQADSLSSRRGALSTPHQMTFDACQAMTDVLRVTDTLLAVRTAGQQGLDLGARIMARRQKRPAYWMSTPEAGHARPIRKERERPAAVH